LKLISNTKQMLHNKLKGRSFFKNVLLLVGGTVFAQIIMVAASPIISRLFSPKDIGILSIYTSILGMIAAFATLRFELAIPITDNDESAINVLALSVGSVFIVSTVVLSITLTIAEPFIVFLNAEPLRPYFWLLSIGVLGIGLYTTALHWALRKKAYKDITRTKVNQGIAKVSVQIASGFAGFGPVGLILGEIFGQAFGIRTLSKSLLREDRKLFKSIKLDTIKAMASRYKKFPLVLSWSALLNTAGLQVPVLILSAFYGAEITGSFGFSQRIISLPLNLIGVAISQVFFSEGATLSKENPERLLKLTVNTSKKLLLIGLSIAMILIPFGPWLFSFVFGAAWREAGVYSRVLSIMLVARFTVNPISRTLIIIEKQGIQFFLDFLRLVLIISAFCISKILEFDALGAVGMYSTVMTIVYLVTYIVIIRELKRNLIK